MTVRVRKGFALLAVTVLVAAGCGSSGDDEASTDDTTPSVTASDTSSTSEGGEAPATTAGGDSERDTFVAIEGVPGVTDDEISFAVIGTKEGNPLGTCILDCYVEGIQAYFDYRNSEGGVYGRDLVIGEVLDDQLSMNQARALEVISGDDEFGTFQATLAAGGWGDLDSAGVPTFTWGIHATEAADRPAIFGSVPAACADCTARTVSYLVGLSGAKKFASLGYGVSENSKVCAKSTADSVEKYSDDIGGVEVVYLNDNIEFGVPNGLGPQVTEMKNLGVDFISTCTDLNAMKTLAQELQRQDMDDVILYHPNTYNQKFVAEAGGIFDGDFVAPSFLPFEATGDNASQAAFFEWMDKNGSELTELAMTGWINGEAAFEGLIAAGPEFDRQKVIDGLNSLTDFDAAGLINPIDWTRQHTAPTEGDPANDSVRECFPPVQVVDGAFETVADPATPWLCWSNETLDWAEPEQVAFG